MPQGVLKPPLHQPGRAIPLREALQLPGARRPRRPYLGGRIIAAYWYLFPDPNDDTYSLVMSAQDQILWKKINRLYIGFATVQDGVLTDLPVGTTADSATQRADMQRRIQEVVSLCRENNPNAEIFITSNFGGDLDNQYLTAAQDPQKFADSVIAYLKEYDLDGYDMDWESTQIDNYAPQLTSLLSTCHATFAAAGTNPHGLARGGIAGDGCRLKGQR